MNEKNIKNTNTNCRQMRVQVPSSVNVKELVKGLNFTRTRAENIKNKIYYFLSRIVSTKDNFKLNEKNDGFRNISSVIMRKIMGRKDYYLILDLLTNPKDPIIESDNSYQKWQSERNKGYCKGYRLIEKYNTGEVVYKTISKKTHERINRHIPEEKERKLLEAKYQFLLNQFKKHVLEVDPGVNDYIRSFGNELLAKVKNQNEYQTKMVYNLIGRWRYYVEKIQKHEIWCQISPANHRLNSSFTSFKKTMRPFLLCDGKPLCGIDISASQPYFLSSVMSNRFFTDTGDGFNLYSIYQEVYNELASKGFILGNVSSTCLNNLEFGPVDSSGPGFSAFSSCASSSSGNSASSGFSQVSPPFMWGHLFDDKDIESITNYQNSQFDSDFYKTLITTCQSMTGEVEVSYEKQRQQFKDNMMLVLFDDNWNHRNTIENIKSFQMIFPGVNKWIEMMFELIGKSRLSYLLQRTESYMVLDMICREFHEKYPSRPIFTVHDAIFTYEEYLSDLRQLLLERFYDITGVKVGIKTKCEKAYSNPKPEDIEEEWKEMKSIINRKNFDKVHGGVFISNIERGAEFLKSA
jgi:hypothetical protein